MMSLLTALCVGGADQLLTPGTKPWDLNPVHDWKMEMGLRKTSLGEIH
jgi:hypothetical protein